MERSEKGVKPEPAAGSQPHPAHASLLSALSSSSPWVLSTADRAVLDALFADYARVAVEGELSGGFSGARVLKVTPFRDADTPELPTVVKIGPADLVRQEHDAYRRHIRGRLSGIPEVWGEPVFSPDGAVGGLRYGLVGAGLFEFVSLARYAESAAPADLAHVLESRVFVHLSTIWRQSRLVTDAPLGEAYADFLRPDRSAHFAAALAGVGAGKALADEVGSGDGTRDARPPDAGAAVPDLDAPTVVVPNGGAASPTTSHATLPNPLAALPDLLAQPIPHRVATIHGDLNLENVLVDPDARTVRLIDFSLSREDHVLHDLLRLETGLVTRVLPGKLAAAGLGLPAVIDIYRRLHTAADAGPGADVGLGVDAGPGADAGLGVDAGTAFDVRPTVHAGPAASAGPTVDALHPDAVSDPALQTVYIALVAIRKAAIPLLADPADWREYLVGLAAYLVGAGKYRNLDAPAKAAAFWAAAAALDLAVRHPAANLAALDRAIPVLLERNPVLEAYRRGRVAEWAGPRHELDDRFVELALLVDQGEEAAAGRWQAREKRYASLRALLDEIPDPALVVLGSPGSGKSTLLGRLELEYALAGLDDGAAGRDVPLTFYLPLSHYKAAGPADPPPPPRQWLAAQWAARFPKLPPLDDLLAEGRIVLLLDALNEMPSAGAADSRARVGLWKDFVQDVAATGAGSRIVFSCRSLDYSTPLSTPALRVPQVRVEPLSDAQIRRFLEQYVPGHAEGLWATLERSGHLDVVRSPYFLRLLVEQVEATGEVPLGRAALFTGFVRQAMTREVERDHPLFRPEDGFDSRAPLLTERDVHRLTAGRGWRTPHELPERGVLVPKLADLAFRMQARSEASGEAAQVRVDFDTALDLLDHPQGADIVAAGAALGVLDEDLGLDEVRYVHQLVQEYFAARELAKAPDPELALAPWRAADIRPSVPELIATLPPADELPPLPTTGWEETTVLAAAMTADPATFVRGLMATNLVLAGRCAVQLRTGWGAKDRSPLPDTLLDELRWALVRRSRDVEADLRARIAAGLAVGDLGDPRFERRVGPYGEYLVPPMVAIPGGVYPIGDDEPIFSDTVTHHVERSAMPRHRVSIAGFAIGQFLVTNAEFACFMVAGGYEDARWWTTESARSWQRGEAAAEALKQNARNGLQSFRDHPDLLDAWHDQGQLPDDVYERWLMRLAMTSSQLEAHLAELYPVRRETAPRYWRDARFDNPAQPVVGVTWYEACAFCAWLAAQTGLGLRLPTEVELEAAARGMTGRRFTYGNAHSALGGNTLLTHIAQPTPVGVFVDGDTPHGVSDGAGNVMAWTSSAWGPEINHPTFVYPYDSGDGREHSEALPHVHRVMRGGSWNNPFEVAQAACRNKALPVGRYHFVGMRLASSAAISATAH